MQAIAIEAGKNLVGSLLWPALLHSLWIGFLAASVAALTFQVCTRLPHQARYRILLAALLFSILGPAVATGLQHVITSRAKTLFEPGPAIATDALAPYPTSGDQTTKRADAIVIEPVNPSRLRDNLSLSGFLRTIVLGSRRARFLLLAGWMLGVAVCGGILAVGARRQSLET